MVATPINESVTKLKLLIQYTSLVLYVVYTLVAFAGMIFESDILYIKLI